MDTTTHGSSLCDASLLQAAKAFMSRGWPVIPLSGKLSRVPWKEFQTRLPTHDELDAWFADGQTTGLGIVTGRVSGLVVVDCDSRQDAEFWRGEHGGSPLLVATGGGGVHFYYALPAGAEVRNRIRLLSRRIDVRGEGGYATAPPSLHASGKRYEWLSFDEAAKLPLFNEAWLNSAHQERRLPTTSDSAPIRKAVAYIHRIQAVAGEGGHNATFRAACKLRDAGLTKDEALAILEGWNETNTTPPWSAQELRHKIESAYAAVR